MFRIKFNTINKDNFLALVPFLLVYIGTIFQNISPSITAWSKTISFIYMVVYVICVGKIKVNLFKLTLLFLSILIYGILITFNFKAGISDGIRYLFPILTLFYSYSINDKLDLLIKFIVFFVIINFLVQIVNYYYWIKGVDQWFYYQNSEGLRYYNEASGILRATGTVVFFGFYGFFNLVAFFILKQFYNKKYKFLLLSICFISVLISLSYKTLIIFFLIYIIYYYKFILKIIPLIFLILLSACIYFPHLIKGFMNDIKLRFNVYILEGNSMRAESYRVMFEEFKNMNLFGKGVGMFGGPASIQYNSPYYQDVYFYWYDTKWLELPTTDTYPPHLFVELGIIGGFIYLLTILVPLYKNDNNKGFFLILIIYFSLMFDMLFSFSLNNIEYLLFSLVFIYPILYHEKYE